MNESIKVPSVLTSDGEQFPTHLLFTGEWLGSLDITGGGHGGTGTGKLRKARAAGHGEDNQARFARILAEWLEGESMQQAAERAAIVEALRGESELGKRLLVIGARAAGKAGRKVHSMRGVHPSATSLEDASADAVCSVLSRVRKLDQVPSEHWHGCGTDKCLPRAISINLANRRALHTSALAYREAIKDQADAETLAAIPVPVIHVQTCARCERAARLFLCVTMYAGRGAFNSLCAWGSNGATGDNTIKARARRDKYASWTSFDALVTDALGKVECESGAPLEDRRASGDLCEYDLAAEQAEFRTAQSLAARRAFCRWVFRVGFVQFKAGLPVGNPGAMATAIRSARMRCRVVCSVILGAPLVEAVAATHYVRVDPSDGAQVVFGFESVKSFAESCAHAGFWPSLQRAAIDSADTEQARIAARRFGLEAGAIAKQLLRGGKSYVRPLDVDGNDLGVTFAECASGAKLRTSRQARARGEFATTALRVRSLRRQLREAVTLARHWRGVVAARLTEQREAWKQVTRGLSADFGSFADLRRVLGFTDKRGRERNARKLNPTGIRRARGTVSRVAVFTARNVPAVVTTASEAAIFQPLPVVE